MRSSNQGFAPFLRPFLHTTLHTFQSIRDLAALVPASPATIAREVRCWSIGSGRSRGRSSLLFFIPENDVAHELAENVGLRMGCEENRDSA